jgi:outer membrane protein OmpA-like peptidoglycan-associated protein
MGKAPQVNIRVLPTVSDAGGRRADHAAASVRARAVLPSNFGLLSARRSTMKSIVAFVCVLVFLWPCMSMAETWEEYVRLRQQSEAPTMTPKGGLKPDLIPKDVIVQRISEGEPVEFKSNSILFEYGLARVRPEYMAQVRIIAESLRDPRISQVSFFYVDGHTCSIGSDANNCRLSWERAATIVEHLADLGVPKSKLRPRGYGERVPEYDNSSDLGRQQNRRVVLVGQGVVKSRALSNEQMCRETTSSSGSCMGCHRDSQGSGAQRSRPTTVRTGTESQGSPSRAKDIPKGFSTR